jgi:hypothetical protein
MSIYRKDMEFNLDHIFITDYGELVEMGRSIKKENKIDFSSIKSIVGDKNIINLSFEDQLKDSLTYGE